MSQGLGTYDGVTDLLETLDRQVEFYLSREDDRLLMGLPHLLSFIERDPRLSALVSELCSESAQALSEFETRGRRLCQAMYELWPEARQLLEGARRLPQSKLDKTDNFDAFEAALRQEDTEVDATSFMHRDEPSSDDPRRSAGLFRKLQDWLWSARRAYRSDELHVRERLELIEAKLNELKTTKEFTFRQHWLDGRVLAGSAYERLRYKSRWINPPPPPGDNDDGEHAGHVHLNTELLEALYGLRNPVSDEARERLAEAAAKVRQDLALVHLNLRARVALGRSNLGLLKRFATRCERFDAARLRELAAQGQHNIENLLRHELARFLFDQGLNPLLDPDVGSLRPDVLDTHLGRAVYVEAKQYTNRNERQQVIKGFRQALDTRGRLRSAFGNVEEAFLVVFRLGGRRVEFPEVIQLPAGAIYAVLVDIAPPELTGSRQKRAPIMVSESELIT